MDELVPLNNITPKQRGWLLREVARRKDYVDIKKAFDYMFAPQVITGQEILDIVDNYPDELRAAERAELADVSSVAVAHQKLRLEKIQWAIEQCEVARPTGSYRKTVNGQDEWVINEEPDFTNLAKFIALAQTEQFTSQKLLLEKIKLDLEIPEFRKSGIREITVDAGEGLDEDEDVVVRPPERDPNEQEGQG